MFNLIVPLGIALVLGGLFVRFGIPPLAQLADQWLGWERYVVTPIEETEWGTMFKVTPEHRPDHIVFLGRFALADAKCRSLNYVWR